MLQKLSKRMPFLQKISALQVWIFLCLQTFCKHGTRNQSMLEMITLKEDFENMMTNEKEDLIMGSLANETQELESENKDSRNKSDNTRNIGVRK